MKAKMKRYLWIFSICLPLVAFVGCAAADNALRVHPITTFDVDNYKEQPTGNNVVDWIMLYEIEEDGSYKKVEENHVNKSRESLGEDYYVTADISLLLKKAVSDDLDKKACKRAIEFLIYLSDRNANVWMHRIFALNKFRKGAIGTTRDLAAGGAAASSLIAPPVAAGFATFNLFAGSISNEIDLALYSNESVSTLFKGIAAARKKKYDDIMLKLQKDDFDFISVLNDVQDYDSMTSFRRGLEYLGDLATKELQKTTPSASSESPTAKDQPKASDSIAKTN